ncbi:MAG: HlyD family efflux transporter periplasmic adaptor subunit, partial [Verrucomicrobia bacterium]|nr:HlyD family efflux transporter periplasmic adaptor subunit [Verrucomicrobiota bacterium]
VSAGQAVSGSGGFNSGTEVLTIADLTQMIINAHVNQADVSRLTVGLNVEIQVEAISGLTVMGIVERIAPQATIENGIKGFSARIFLKEIDPRIQPGMTANIKIPVQSAAGVVAVPLGAVFTEYNESIKKQERYVFVQIGESFERRLIQIGVADYFFAEVLSGLKAGETVSLEQPPAESIVNANAGSAALATLALNLS